MTFHCILQPDFSLSTSAFKVRGFATSTTGFGGATFRMGGILGETITVAFDSLLP